MRKPVANAVLCFFIPLSALVMAFPRTAIADEWQLVFDVTQEKQISSPRGDAPLQKEVHSFILTVALGNEYLVVDDGQRRTVYDFGRRRAIYMKLDRKVYDDFSLYSVVGDRVAELLNRTGIGAALRAAKISSAAENYGRFDNETNLHLLVPGIRQVEPEPVIETVESAGGAMEFRHDGQTVVEFVPATTRIPEPFFRRFASFLAYEGSIHPKIRHEIAASGRIPQQLVVRWHEVNVRTTATYRLRNAERAEADSSALSHDARPAAHAEDPFYHVLDLFNSEGHSTHRITREDAVHFTDESVADKRYLDAVLALTEYGLQCGEQPIDELRQNMAKFDQDDRCKQYFACVHKPTPPNRATFEKCLALCESIDRRQLQKGYMLDLERAVLLMQLGQGRTHTTDQIEKMGKAEALFIKVLDANPFLAGAYHDLGHVYINRMECPKAWICFDTARRLYPEHPMLREVTALEQRYEQDFPDFF